MSHVIFCDDGINCCAQEGKVFRLNITTPYVLIATVVIRTQIMFMANPVDAMSFVDMVDAA